MKVYIINITTSEFCDIENKVFLNYEKAIKEWNKLYKEEKENYKSIDDLEEEDINEEEFILDKENKTYSYFDGQNNNLISLNTFEVEE